VVAADRRIGGFNGSWGSGAAIDRKRALLEEEGVHFEPDGERVSEASLHRFESKPERKRKRAESAGTRVEPLDAQIEATILALLRERGADKTC